MNRQPRRPAPLLLLLALATLASALAGCPADPQLDRLVGIWVPAQMQSADSAPVDNPQLGFRFDRTTLVVRKPTERFVAPYSATVVNGTTLQIHAENEKTKQVQDLTVEFTGPDSAKFTIGRFVAVFVRVPAANVALDFDKD